MGRGDPHQRSCLSVLIVKISEKKKQKISFGKDRCRKCYR